MNQNLSFHESQSAIYLLQAMRTFVVAGRNWGKSTLFGAWMQKLVQNLPGASGIIAAKNYAHILTSVLPSAFSMLEKMGYHKDIHYTIGKPAPKEWRQPYHPPIRKFDNYITFFNPDRCVGFDLRSQDKSSGRGPNRDFLLSDETLLLNKEKMDTELFPTIRANKGQFKQIPFHLGEYHSTSMPIDQSGKWILDEAAYYLQDFGVDIIAIWKQIINLQIQLLDITEKEEFKKVWNEIQRLKRIIRPRLSKDGKTLFVFGNSLDNWRSDGGLKYIKNQMKRLPWLIFLIEIMNMVLELTGNNFYAIEREKHVYYDSFDNTFLENLAIGSGWDWKKLAAKDCRFLSKEHYRPDEPLFSGFDWGGSVSFMLSGQLLKKEFKTLDFQKEFWVKPDVGEMTGPLLEQFCNFYEPHPNKTLLFIRDSYGDDKSNSINNSRTINEQAIEYLKKNKWKVITKKHSGKEPPYFEKWQLIGNCFNKKEKKFFDININGNECKNLIVSLQNTKSVTVDNKFSKDKRNERKDNIDQSTTTHSTDAFDKIIYTLFKDNTQPAFIDIKMN